MNEWLDQNARAAWLTCGDPPRGEEDLIRSVSLPLNLDQNRHHNFHAALSAMRRAAKMRAQKLPIV